MSNKQRAHPRGHDAGSFECRHCGLDVSANAPGTAHRNHCPNCLWSSHVDEVPGDRASGCGALMEPIAISVRGSGEWLLIHRCTNCGVLHINRTAGDDNPLLLLKLAVGPLAQPPFPIERMVQPEGLTPTARRGSSSSSILGNVQFRPASFAE